ncbi:putative disease resistance protein [Sesamum angolense]|uniref:Disease resistance protein n=1 Tax=Sesamum angolense TaxID=2727404 RepID=A0AAE1WJP5_9LAMI|nr:putative disease resistance protein [Sesamum angolense]
MFEKKRMLIWENKLSATEVTRMKTCNMLHVGQWHNHVCPCCEKQEKPLFGTKIRVTQKKTEPKPDKGKKKNFYKEKQDCPTKNLDMAVAAYATLRSLSYVLNNLQHPARLRRLHVDTNQIQSLHEKVQFLLDFLEAHSQRMSEEIGDLGRQIADAAAEAEEVVDRNVVDQLRYRSQEESHCMAALSSFSQDIDKVTGKVDSLTKEMMKMVNEEWAVDAQEEQQIVSVPVRSAEVHLSSGKKSTMVGFDEHLERIVDKLTTGEPNLQPFPIVGMGGIGKTTLAQNVFDHPYTVHYFPKRIWFTISQEYSVRELLLRLLDNGKKQENSETLAELGQRLYQSLFGERYLIVMDDVWSIEVWNDLKLFFPNNGKGSRVMLTTRESSLAISLGSQESYSLDFLNEEKSWNLFCQETFGQEGCPYPELEEIGKNIAKSCNGLPLTIVVLSGLLPKSNMTREYWESVAENVNTFRNSKDYERCLKILSLSYKNLPVHLKPCFLYMGIFPEDSEIRVSKLTRLWIAEGFLKPIRVLPYEIWDMPQLRHFLGLAHFVLPKEASTQDFMIMENLHVLSGIRNFRCTEEKLESLSIKAEFLPLESLTFPTSLKELCLDGWDIPWEKMMTIGSLLPNLEKLVLELIRFKGTEWNQVEGDFPRLKFLKISNNYRLKRWRAENIHFPILESLFLSYMLDLEEIPTILGDIPTLHSIYLDYSEDCLIDLAKEIVEEQHSYGNEILQLYIGGERYQVGSS